MTTPYAADELPGLIADHQGWEVAQDGTLQARFRFKDFAHALLFVNAVGHLAEAADHHPDIAIQGYRNVQLNLTSHDAGGVTDRDVSLIRAIEDLPGAVDALA